MSMQRLSLPKMVIGDPVGGFGELKTSNITPSVEIIFTYTFNSILLSARNNNGGSNTVSNSQITASTGTSANSSSGFVSKAAVRYNPGQGTIARFTALFTEGVEGSSQLVGIGDSFEGYFFGYSGSTFGILYRYGGLPETRTLTITTKSTTAEDISITLDGDTANDVSVTDATSGDTTTTANDIASYDYSQVGTGWTARAIGSTVIFASYEGGSKSGSYSLSGASTAVGTFAQTIEGVTPTDTFTARSSWNFDSADSEGEIQQNIDVTKGNVYQIEFQYLGYGQAVFSIENPISGKFSKVHTINYPNTATRPIFNIPTRPLSILAKNTTNTSNLSVSSASMMGGSVGTNVLNGIRRGFSYSKTGITTTEVPVFSIYNSDIYNGNINRAQVDILLISVSNDHTKAMRINFYTNATITGASFSNLDSNLSPIQTDTSATNATGGILLFTIELASNSNQLIDLAQDKYLIPPGNTLTITAQTVSGTGAICSSSLHWIELQ